MVAEREALVAIVKGEKAVESSVRLVTVAKYVSFIGMIRTRKQRGGGLRELKLAIFRHNFEEITDLLNSGPAGFINQQDEKGNTPLHTAAESYVIARDNMVILRRNPQAWRNAREAFMRTEQEREDSTKKVVLLLIEKGADLTIKNNKGQTAFNIINDPLVTAKLRMNQDRGGPYGRGSLGNNIRAAFHRPNRVQKRIRNSGIGNNPMTHEMMFGDNNTLNNLVSGVTASGVGTAKTRKQRSRRTRSRR